MLTRDKNYMINLGSSAQRDVTNGSEERREGQTMDENRPCLRAEWTRETKTPGTKKMTGYDFPPPPLDKIIDPPLLSYSSIQVLNVVL